MKTNMYTERIRGSKYLPVGMTLILLMFGFIMPSRAQVLYGPESPPPKGASIVFTGSLNDGEIGRPGGKLYTYSAVMLSSTTTVYWSILPGTAMLSMDGNTYTDSEILDYNASLSNPAAGLIIWSGSTFIPIANDNGIGIKEMRPLLSRFRVTVTAPSGPVALEDPSVPGIPSEAGAVVLVTGADMLYYVRMEMLVSDDNGVTWIPHLTYYDAAQTPAAAESAYSSYDYGFYWKNDPPELANNLIVNVDEGYSAIITNSILKAIDVESTSDQLVFTFDPRQTGLLPANGVCKLNGDTLKPGDTFTQTMVDQNLLSYIHDGSETEKDSFALMLTDSDGYKAYFGDDTVFYLVARITPVDDPPVLVNNTGTTADEGGQVVLTNTMLLTTDAESTADKVIYTLDPIGSSAYPLHGQLKKNDIPMQDGSTFTQEDVDLGHIVYVHDGSETLSDGFEFSVSDEYGHSAKIRVTNTYFFSITVNPVNDPPYFNTLETLTLDEGSTGYITSAFLAVSDPDGTDSEIIFTVDPKHDVENPVHGILKLGETQLQDGSTFTMSDVNNNLLSYVHDGSEESSDFFVFSVADNEGGIIRDGEYTEFHFSFSITQVNDLPQLANPIADQLARALSAFTFALPEASFSDPDPGDELSFEAFGLGESDLPGWLSFNTTSATFTGTPAVADKGEVYVVVRASDLSLTSALDTFIIKVESPVSQQPALTGDLPLVYPNPSRGEVFVTVGQDRSGALTVQVFDLLGKEILRRETVVTKGSAPLRLDLSGQKSGIYILKTSISGSEQTRKLILQ
ncbi:MAG: cadherin-like domain-containing protein [Bacteroidota bacterium]